MKIVLPEQWIPSDNIQLENAADEAVRASTNILVVAGPGAGKTELLAQKAGFLFSTNQCTYPRKILAISFKNDAADNLKKRVVRRFGKEINDRFISQTYDAFAKSIVDRFRLALPDGNIPNSNYVVNNEEIIDAAFKLAGYIPPKGEYPSKTKAFYDNTLASVKLPLCGDGLAENVWRLLLNGFDDYVACLSFKMITMLAIFIMKSNKQLRNAIQLTYSHIFLDEFQDTTSLQYELVKACFYKSNCCMTAVGDNKQRIMLWAGAKPNIFNDFYNDFHADGKHLIMNHRSAPRLVELQKAMYNSLNDKNEIVIPSGRWSIGEGEIYLLVTKDNQSEEEALTKNIQYQISSGVKPNDICILCKQKPADYTKGLIIRLSEIGIKARIEIDYQDLLKEPIIELLIALFRLSIDMKKPEDWEFLTGELGQILGIDNSINQKDKYYKMQENLTKFIYELACKRKCVSEYEELYELIVFIVNFIGENKIKANYITYSQGNNLEKQVSKFSKLFWKELIDSKLNWENAINSFLGIDSIPIMTIHKSKGLEYSVVYFVGLEDAAFWNFRNQPEEDRCAFFVALSRAKQNVTFTYCEYRNGFKFPQQRRNQINEFFTLLRQPGIAQIIVKD